MKLSSGGSVGSVGVSPSTRRVWVEIEQSRNVIANLRSPSTRRVWVEIIREFGLYRWDESPSTRRVWVEIV